MKYSREPHTWWRGRMVTPVGPTSGGIGIPAAGRVVRRGELPGVGPDQGLAPFLTGFDLSAGGEASPDFSAPLVG